MAICWVLFSQHPLLPRLKETPGPTPPLCVRPYLGVSQQQDKDHDQKLSGHRPQLRITRALAWSILTHPSAHSPAEASSAGLERKHILQPTPVLHCRGRVLGPERGRDLPGSHNKAKVSLSRFLTSPLACPQGWTKA